MLACHFEEEEWTNNLNYGVCIKEVNTLKSLKEKEFSNE